MMAFMADAPASFCFSISYHNQIHRNDSIVKSQKTLICKKPLSRTISVNYRLLADSYKTGDVSSSNVKTIHGRVTDSNNQIHRFCEVGNLEKAMELLHASGKSEIDVRTYCSILQLCADLKSLTDGRKVHSIVGADGSATDGVLGSKLVFMYATCGDLREARRLFDQIANENVFLWNLLINEYGKRGDFRGSIQLFKRMLKIGIETDSYSFSSILKSYGALGSVYGGEQLHGHVLKSGFGDCTSVANSLIAFYFKIRRVENADKLFDELTHRDSISWNSMISGYIANRLAEKGLEVFRKMLFSGINVDLATIVTVISGCANSCSLSIGRAIHGFGLKSCFAGESRFYNTLLDMYSKCGDLDSAKFVFKGIRDKSVVSYTSMIAGYAREELAGESVRLFCKMEKDGISPDVYTVATVLNSCARNGLLQEGKDVHKWTKEQDMESNLFVSNALMDMYAKCGSMEEAKLVFSQMPVKDIVSWNTMIGGYSQNRLANEAISLFSAMLEERQSNPDARTMACVLPACASLAAFEKGREIHGHIIRNGYFSDRHVANSLVDMYVKCGALLLAHSLFDKILSKDLVSWTVMIAGYGMHGFGIEAITLFNEMRKTGIDPDEISFVSILYACSHSGLIDEGWRFFNVMRSEYKIEPKLEHYACMVDLLARAGQLSKAYNFIEKMRISPDATIWGALLCGCRIHHDVKLAEKVAEKVFELEPENTGYYVLMANIYAEAQKWEEVKKLRQKIGRRGLRKNPGCSWIEIKGKVNIFVAGDSSHPQTERIESLLRRLRARMREEGYSPLTKYALIDADEMEKEEALCGHSEKLAMAFGILCSGRGKIIRVTKNLRVCGDCHEMAKFMSRITRREILLRDSNRFHHFKDGHCSCRGFW